MSILGTLFCRRGCFRGLAEVVAILTIALLRGIVDVNPVDDGAVQCCQFWGWVRRAAKKLLLVWEQYALLGLHQRVVRLLESGLATFVFVRKNRIVDKEKVKI